MTHNFALKSRTSDSAWLPVVRILLGIALVWKGLGFTHDTSQLQVALQRSQEAGLSVFASVTAAIVSIGTLMSGIFLMVGFFTKTISITQLGFIAAALAFIYFTNIERTALDNISTLVIVPLVVLFAIKGSGRISFDEPLQRKANR